VSSAQRNGDERAINQISPRESERRQSGSISSWGWTHPPEDCGADKEMVFEEEEETRRRRRRGASRKR